MSDFNPVKAVHKLKKHHLAYMYEDDSWRLTIWIF